MPLVYGARQLQVGAAHARTLLRGRFNHSAHPVRERLNCERAGPAGGRASRMRLQNFSVFSANVRPLNCSDGKHICGDAATCIDVQPLSVAPKFTTASCLCPPEYFPNPNSTSLALAPYGFDPSAIGLPDDFDPTIIGLPRTTVDYCVRSSKNLEPSAHTHIAGRSRTRVCLLSHRSRHACRWSRT